MPDSIDSRRIANLEAVVRQLGHEVEALRAELRGTAPRWGTGAAAEEGVETAEQVREQQQQQPARDETTTAPPPRLARPAILPPPASSAPPNEGAARPRRPAPAAADRRVAASLDVEGLVGRYGTIALAALTIVMGVGAFLRWAVEHVRIGPELRVAFGALLAAAIAATGLWLRARARRSSEGDAATRRFGNVLLGLALAVAQVDAWGAGPYLHVVPPTVALSIAALASAALAVLALVEGEEALFATGLGGALLAPFVTSTGNGSVPALLTYGWVVLAGACAALGGTLLAPEGRSRPWTIARRLASLGVVAYVVAGLAAPASMARVFAGPTLLYVSAPALFALAVAWTALWLAGGLHRVEIARAALVGALVAIAARAMDDALNGSRPFTPTSPAAAGVALAFVGAATAFAAAWAARAEDDDGRAFVWATLLPTAFLLAALTAVPDTRGLTGAAVSLAWTVLGFGAARALDNSPFETRRQYPLVVAGWSSAAAVLLLLSDHPVAAAAALAAHGALWTVFAARERAVLTLLPAATSLLASSWWAAILLDQRRPYAYVPFMTSASLAALAAVAGVTAFGLVAARGDWRHPLPVKQPRGAAIALGATAAFLWGNAELAHAFSPDLATFLLIGYYAAVGIVTILVGRRKTLAGARRVGLGLAVFAALKALAQASGLTSVGLRVGSYLLVGLFLLGVAYLYRATGDEGEAVTVGEGG
ncbi:MAG TPA: DUF2339 domain-containing protein [Gemmatimonadaceae bacterium]|nr:DUF2339 domain-containing protein [Gemmatimonadaceae bacterium]